MSRAYYNEFDPYAAQWLRNLVAAGHIADGDVDDRSITDVSPKDVAGYTQCHFFAGIGGWSHALRLAGWADDRPVWTGSCPCQPFSSAGKGAGTADERHLWPVWFNLIRECRPVTVFGEQVEAAIGHGWLDLVQSDLEGEGYAVGAIGLPACSVGAPHIRQRLWFVADATGGGCEREQDKFSARILEEGAFKSKLRVELGSLCPSTCQLADAKSIRQSGHREIREPDWESPCRGRSGDRGTWGAADWLSCTDGKRRPVEPGTFPLAYGIPNRVGRLRAYGNAIVPQVAAEVIGAFMECQN